MTESRSFRVRYHSLQDYLTAKQLTVDATVQDGWNASFPVKGREIEATVLFADISGFSARTASLDPTATLIFVNHFFTWIAAEALHGRPGIIDKYIGDEVMVVFSREFGSEDPFVDAVQTARWMGQNDAFAFGPHMGIASGEVIVGYAGTPLRYNCSVYGAPVTIAARCAAAGLADDDTASSLITFPASDWRDRDFKAVFPEQRIRDTDGSTFEQPHGWELLPPRSIEMKNLGTHDVHQVVNRAFWAPMQSASDRARETASAIAEAGRRWHPERTDPQRF